MEGPILGGFNVRREIFVSKSIGIACSRKEICHFCFVLLCIRGQIPSTSPPGGAYIWRGLFSKFYGIYNDNLVCNTNLQRVLKKKNEYKDKMNVTSVRFES